jgi:lipase chaperone LimK
VDASGHLVPTPCAIALFDHFLSATGDQPAAQIRARILAESAALEQRLPWPRELRRKHFGAEREATIFGDDERAAALAIEERRVESDASLSETEKRARRRSRRHARGASMRGSGFAYG